MEANIFEIGDRVKDTNTKSHGVVIDLDLNGFEDMPRAKVDWYKDNSHELVDHEKQGWICEGNLILLEVCPKCKKTEFFIDNLKNQERRCRLCYTHWDNPF